MRTLLVFLLAFMIGCASLPINSVGRIDIKIDKTVHIGNGTLFAVDETLLITAAHVCSALETLDIPGLGLYYKDTELKIVKQDKTKDLCLLKSEKPILLPVKLAPSNKMTHYQKVYVFGYPLGVDLMLTEGYLSSNRFHTEEGGPKRLLLSAAAFGGNSGGPILNENFEVIGVLIAGVQIYPHISIAVTLEDLKEFIGVEQDTTWTTKILNFFKDLF